MPTLKIKDEYFVKAARILYERDGELEIDEGAPVSRGTDNGAYVQAWVWIENADAKEVRKRERKKKE